MSQRAFAKITTLVFLAIFILHLARLVYGWEAVINGASIPMWLSWIAVILSGYLAYQGLKIAK